MGKGRECKSKLGLAIGGIVGVVRGSKGRGSKEGWVSWGREFKDRRNCEREGELWRGWYEGR